MKDEFDSSNNFNEYLGKNMKGTDSNGFFYNQYFLKDIQDLEISRHS